MIHELKNMTVVYAPNTTFSRPYIRSHLQTNNDVLTMYALKRVVPLKL